MAVLQTVRSYIHAMHCVLSFYHLICHCLVLVPFFRNLMITIWSQRPACHVWMTVWCVVCATADVGPSSYQPIISVPGVRCPLPVVTATIHHQWRGRVALALINLLTISSADHSLAATPTQSAVPQFKHRYCSIEIHNFQRYAFTITSILRNRLRVDIYIDEYIKNIKLSPP